MYSLFILTVRGVLSVNYSTSTMKSQYRTQTIAGIIMLMLSQQKTKPAIVPNLYAQPIETVLSLLVTDKEGLTHAEAKSRLKVYGANILKTKNASWLKRLLEPFSNLFVSVLLVAVGVSILTNEILDAVVIGIVLA